MGVALGKATGFIDIPVCQWLRSQPNPQTMDDLEAGESSSYYVKSEEDDIADTPPYDVDLHSSDDDIVEAPKKNRKCSDTYNWGQFFCSDVQSLIRKFQDWWHNYW